MNRFLTLSFVAALVFAPVCAQAQSVNARVAALEQAVATLTTRVNKLEGNIVATDLAGNYRLIGVSTDLDGTDPAAIQSIQFSGTVTLSAVSGTSGGIGSFSITGGGRDLHFGVPPSEAPLQVQDSGNITWTYANGTLTIPELGVNYNVAAGGRVLTYSGVSDDDTVDFQILTRLN